MWACLQKLRREMVPTGRNQLSNDVEIDETYVGGVQAGVEGADTGETKPWWQWRHRSTTKPSSGFACAASPPPLSRDREWSRMGGKVTRGWRHSGTNTRTK